VDDISRPYPEPTQVPLAEKAKTFGRIHFRELGKLDGYLWYNRCLLGDKQVAVTRAEIAEREAKETSVSLVILPWLLAAWALCPACVLIGWDVWKSVVRVDCCC